MKPSAPTYAQQYWSKPITDRDQIYEALFQRVKATVQGGAPPLVKTCGRRHMMPPALTTVLQPAVFVVQTGEHKEPHPIGTAGKLTLHAMIIGYAYDEGAESDPTKTLINEVVSLIEQALEPDDATSGGIQALGGDVYQCRLEGEAYIDPGVFGQQQVAVLKVNIIVPYQAP